MDYSLLMGIHNLTQAKARKQQVLGVPVADPGGGGSSSGESEADASSEGSEDRGRKPHMLERIGSFQQRQRLIAHATALESITAEVDDVVMADIEDETDAFSKVTNSWGGIPAKNH